MYALHRTELSTRRLSMRPIRDVDAETLLAIRSNPSVMCYGTEPTWDSIQKAIDKIERNDRGMAAGESVCLAIFRRDDRRLIGTTDLFQMDPQCRRAEIGFALAAEAWGRGYMNEALTALLDYGFSEFALNRVEADVDPRNTASIKCLARLGFAHEGLLRQRWIVGGEVSDSAIYGLLRDEWRARRSANDPNPDLLT
jgi:ribosomal-protein-alanine N-acetyltransferase